MKSLQTTFDSYVKQKQNIINSKSSYTSTVTIPHERIITSSQIVNSTINIPVAETSAWWAGRGANGGIAIGLNNIQGGMPVLDGYSGGIHEQIRQKIISLTGESNIDVPSQRVMQFGSKLMYQINQSGQYGTVQGTWHDGGEPNNGTIRIFYKLNKLETHTETTYTTRQDFDNNKYQQAVTKAQQLVDGAQLKITQFQQKEAAEKLQQQKAQALVIKQQQEAALKLKQQKEDDAIKLVISTNEKDRAELFFKMYAKPGSENAISNFTINKIKELGFDANHLAYLSIQQNHKVLFELSLQRGADYNSYFAEGRTLLQHLIHSKNDLFIQKALVQCENLSTTAISAIEQNDTLSIAKIVAHDSSLLKQKYDGYSLLQTAIIKNVSTSIVALLLELDNTYSALLSDNGESALKLALIGGNPEIIKLLIDHINLAAELNQLGVVLKNN